jgi:hypothetical protein
MERKMLQNLDDQRVSLQGVRQMIFARLTREAGV